MKIMEQKSAVRSRLIHHHATGINRLPIAHVQRLQISHILRNNKGQAKYIPGKTTTAGKISQVLPFLRVQRWKNPYTSTKARKKGLLKTSVTRFVVSVGKQRCIVLLSPKGITTTPDIFIHYHGYDADYGLNKRRRKGSTLSGSDVVTSSMVSTRANLIALLPQGNIGSQKQAGGRMPALNRLGLPKFVATILAALAKSLNVTSLKPGKIGVSGHSAGGYEGVASTLGKAGALKDNITEVTLMDTAYSLSHFMHAEKWLYSGSPGKSLRIVGRIHQVKWPRRVSRNNRRIVVSHHPYFGHRNIVRRARRYGFKATNIKLVNPDRDHKSKLLQHTKITKAGKPHADVLVLRTEVTRKKTHGILRDQFIDDALYGTGQGMAGSKYFGMGGRPKRKISLKQYNTTPFNMVISKNAILYTAPPRLGKTRKKISQFTRVEIIKELKKRNKTFVKVTTKVGTRTVTLGWTEKSKVLKYNTKMSYRKHDRKHRKYVDRVVKKAGVRPKAYFADFRNITFLGRPTRTPIYRLLADHLKKAEARLMVKHGRGLTPTATGTKLGLSPTVESIKGARYTSKLKSMHLFGLAIDLDYTSNPHVGRFSKKKRGARRPPKSMTEIVYPQASLLVTGKRASLIVTGRQRSWWRPNLSVAQVLEADRILETYFSYLSKPVELAAALKKVRRSPWRGLSVASARHRIKRHLNKVTRAWGRKRNVIKRGGFTNYKKALINGIGLYWGGAGFGDMMHFDMRKTPGLGKKIGSLRYTVSK